MGCIHSGLFFSHHLVDWDLLNLETFEVFLRKFFDGNNSHVVGDWCCNNCDINYY